MKLRLKFSNSVSVFLSVALLYLSGLVVDNARAQKPNESSPKPSPTTSNDGSRQLQQLPPSQPGLTTAPETPTGQTDLVTSLPVRAKRWALVIGVDKYNDPQISSLKGADNDARLVADAL